MRILVATGLYPPEIGGPATYAALLEMGLPKQGIEAEILPYRSVRKYPKVFRHLVYGWMVFRRSHNVDLIVALDPVSVGVPARIVAFLRRKKFLVKVVGDYAWEQARQRFDYVGTIEEFQTADVDLIPQIMRWLERVVVRTATHVVVPSRYLAGIVSGWEVPAEKLSVIYNGVSVSDVGNRDIIRGVLHFSGKLIISVGRLVPWKGFEALIVTFARLSKKDPDLRLFIVGEGPDFQKLEDLTEKEGVSDRVIFAGAVDHGALMRYLKAADVFVLNSSYEGFSHLIAETMAVGTPVITTMVGGNPEIIDDGVSGYLVTPGDTDQLGKRITKLLTDKALYTRMAQEGLKKVHTFTDERVLEETSVLLKKLCV
jgi:glycosyltransferase involved in cell wall biosynthesis